MTNQTNGLYTHYKLISVWASDKASLCAPLVAFDDLGSTLFRQQTLIRQDECSS